MKSYLFALSDDLTKKAKEAIRNKQHVIVLLLLTSKELLYANLNELPDNTNCKAHIYVDKMSRIFYILPHKIFTFQFPFIIRNHENTIKLSYHDINIDSIMTSFLLSIFLDDTILEKSLIDIIGQVSDELNHNEWKLDENECCELIKYLILFESGYLRYDEDFERNNGLIHPENHIDLYYSSNNNIKIGLGHSINEEWFIDLANIKTKCKFLKE